MNFSLQPLMKNVYRFCEPSPEAPVDAYLVIGEKQAVLIDALETAVGLAQAVRDLTELPVSVAVTHGHCDHAGEALAEFARAGCTVYMDPADVEPLAQTLGKPVDPSVFTPFPEALDLGGVRLEVMSLPGHTWGSKVLADRERALLFTGDAVGSGDFWMQLGHSAPLSLFAGELKKLIRAVENLPDLAVLPGHAYQQPRPLGLFYLRDVLAACERVMSGECDRRDQFMRLCGEELVFRTIGHGSLGCMCYDPYKI